MLQNTIPVDDTFKQATGSPGSMQR